LIDVSQGAPTPKTSPPASGGDQTRIGYRLQVLSTEHMSLLATRTLTWNEIFTRSSMFLSALSGALVALALVAQATALGASFGTFALVILPVVFFLGLTTYIRLVQATMEEGMNRIRAGYLEFVPEVRPYLITSPHDDFAGLQSTSGYLPTQRYNFMWGFVTAPAVVGLIDSVLGGAIVAIAALQLGASMPLAIGAGFGGAAVAIAWGIVYGYVVVGKWVGRIRPLSPTPM
jgi:hypothetical protein